MKVYERKFLEMRIRHLERIFQPLDDVVDGIEEDNDFENLSIARNLARNIEDEYHMAKKALDENDYSIFGEWSRLNFEEMCRERGQDPEEVLEMRQEEFKEKWKKKEVY